MQSDDTVTDLSSSASLAAPAMDGGGGSSSHGSSSFSFESLAGTAHLAASAALLQQLMVDMGSPIGVVDRITSNNMSSSSSSTGHQRLIASIPVLLCCHSSAFGSASLF